MPGPNGTADTPQRAPNQVYHYFRDDDTETLLETRYATDLPTPEVGEAVEFATLPLDRTQPTPNSDHDLEPHDETYVVRERTYQYITPTFPDTDPASDQELTILRINLYVDPIDDTTQTEDT